MIILTCANSDKAIEGKDRLLYRNFSFKSVIQDTIEYAKKCNYTPVVYDLGSLGIGERYLVEDESFEATGYYSVGPQDGGGYRSKALFKPEIVKLCLGKYKDLVVYLDGDAQLCGNIDEIVSDDFDIGVTLRDISELESDWHKEHFDIVKYVNAGVIFFNPTPATYEFVDTWQKTTQEVGNDQKALNKLTCPDKYPEANSVHTINKVRVKYFPCKQYNYYYFKDGLVPNIKIMHFKGPVRHYYPFDWKKRLYCKTVIPVLNSLRSQKKRGDSGTEGC